MIFTKYGEVSVTIDKESNGYQWNDQIIKRIMYKKKQSGSEIVP